MGISLRHMDFLSANGARALPWQNTDNGILLAVFGTCIQPSLLNQALLSKKTQVAANPFHQASVDE